MIPDITPIIQLFQSLPIDWIKFIALIVIVYGIGALIAYKTRNDSSTNNVILFDNCDSND